MTHPAPDAAIRSISATLTDAATLLDQAEGAQWRRGYAPARREDTTERASGGHSDPTVATVADERRLEVRAAVVSLRSTISAALAGAGAEIQAAGEQLSDALDRWAGESVPRSGGQLP